MVHVYFDRFTLSLPNECIDECAEPGVDASEPVGAWSTKIGRPNECTPAALNAELREYGAWDDDERADDDANWMRIIWIASNNAREERDNDKANLSRDLEIEV